MSTKRHFGPEFRNFISSLRGLKALWKMRHSISSGSIRHARSVKYFNTYLCHRCFHTVGKPDFIALPKTYQAAFVESRWYDWWISKGYFQPEEKSPKPSFTMILPPPNITGSLHLGHSLTIAIEDAIARWKRMNGFNVLWIPGLDHAGIATQIQVEKHLWRTEKKTRLQIGKTEFLKRADIWKEEKSSRIKQQIRRMGASVDWSRCVFTMDDNIQNLVKDAFVLLFDRGKIYREKKLINWSTSLRSTISDIEVEYKQYLEPTDIRVPGQKEPLKVGILHHFAYKILEHPEKEIVVATTRPETILGDTAIAVHPEDDRYTGLIGCHAVHPFDPSHLIPVIADSSVERDFGTGAVKITPAHDFNDFELGRKHSLPVQTVIDEKGCISFPKVSELHGLSRFAARRKILDMLQEKGLWRRETQIKTSLPFCSRSGDIVEPMVKEQWFLDCKEYAERALYAVESGELRILPDRFDNTWATWLKGNKDWCLSRQLWWGQQIPAFRMAAEDGKTHWTAARNLEDARQRFSKQLGTAVNQPDITQDEDVLDTWFTSSALPALVFGWPEVTKDEKYYPLSLMETGHDILFFWVARMVFMGYALTDQLPFKEVFLHGLICDNKGKKMSKSVGNVIDPMEIVCDFNNQPKKGEVQIGADALRFALCRLGPQQHYLNVDVKMFGETNKFCNKIWQAYNFCSTVWQQVSPTDVSSLNDSNLSLIDIWIQGCLRNLISTCSASMKCYELDRATEALYDFWYEKFCGVYLECIKNVVKDPSSNPEKAAAASSTLVSVFDTYLKLLSPFMPNIAEELYQRIPLSTRSESICVADWPNESLIHLSNDCSEIMSAMEDIMLIGRSVRNIYAQYGIVREKFPVTVYLPESYPKESLDKLADYMAVISRSLEVSMVNAREFEEDGAVDLLDNGMKVSVKLGKIDAEKERQRHQIRLDKLTEMLTEKLDVKYNAGYLRRSEAFREAHEKEIAELNGKMKELVKLVSRYRV